MEAKWSTRRPVIKMLNTRRKLAPLAATREEIINERAIIVTIGFPTSGASSLGDWPRYLTIPGVAIFHNRKN